MRIRWLFFLVLTLTLLMITGVVLAQEETTCELDAEEIISVVESICTHTGDNEVCYGNNDVEIAAVDDAPELDFNVPGDTTNLAFVQSLYLSALNEVDDIWGVAQMRLITATPQGAQEVTMLLYGDVEVDNAVEATMTVDIVATTAVNIRSYPSLNGSIIASAAIGDVYEAVGRLADNSWLRIRVPETGAVGWILTDYIDVASEAMTIDDLDIMEGSDTYFGPMQAFYINTGTNLSCNNVATDGLIIQTPSGAARVRLLVNEVSIELIPPSDGGSATILLQANIENGMIINVIDGSAEVEANGSAYFVGAGTTTSISLNDDLQAEGLLSEPTITDTGDMLDLPILVTPADGPIVPINIIDNDGDGVATSGTNGQGNGQGNGNANGNGQGNGNANGNGQGNGNNGQGNGNNGQGTGNNGQGNGN